jgi:hypothetical protein
VAVTTGTTGASGWNVGKDIVVEGMALRVTAPEELQALADAWFAKYGEDWRFEVRAEVFVELSHSGGSTEGGARVYRVKPAKVIVFGDAQGQPAAADPASAVPVSWCRSRSSFAPR